MGTQSPDGLVDVSPKGDSCDIVKILEYKTRLTPDRPGNNRLDSQTNILANPAVGLLYMHCAKAFRRSKLWDPSQLQDRSEMPYLPKIVLDQTSGAPDDLEDMGKIDADLEDEYKRTMYEQIKDIPLCRRRSVGWAIADRFICKERDRRFCCLPMKCTEVTAFCV